MWLQVIHLASAFRMFCVYYTDVADPQSFKKSISLEDSDKVPKFAGQERRRRKSSGVRVLYDDSNTLVVDLDLVKRRQRAFSLREELFPLLRSNATSGVSV